MESAGAACKIPSGASVALKPNLVVAASPETGATTHAGVLSGAIEYLRDHGFRDISIIEGSWVGDDTGRAFRAAGYEAVGKKYGVPLFDLKRDKTRRVDTPCGPWTSAAAPWTRTTSSTCPCSRATARPP